LGPHLFKLHEILKWARLLSPSKPIYRNLSIVAP
jgi:hypothetical protein